MLVALSKKLRSLVGGALRETGQALDRTGSKCIRDVAYLEKYSRHRKLMPLDELWPSHGNSFIAPNASVIGEVLIGNDCAVWYGCVLKGDMNAIRIDDNVYIGENTVLQTNSYLPKGIPNSITIASNVVIEENCTLTSCLIDSNVKIGSSSHVQGGGKIERYLRHSRRDF